MGQFAVILVLASLLLGGMLIYNARLSTAGADDETTAYHGDRLAREAALVGLEQTKRTLADSTDGWALWDTDSAAVRAYYRVITPTAHGDATYTTQIDSMSIVDTTAIPGPTTVNTISDKVWVTSRATYDVWNPDNNAFEETRYFVKATYEKGWTDIGTPPIWRRAIVGNNLCWNGNTTISGSIHANAQLCGNPSNSYVIYGEGTYTGSISGQTRQGAFTGGVAYHDLLPVPPVVIPPVADRHCTIAGPLTINTQNVTVSNGWPLCAAAGAGHGTASDPFVLVVTGDIQFRGNVNLKGYVKIYSTGSITFANNSSRFTPVDASVSLPANNSPMSVIEAWANTHLVDGSGTFIGSTLGVYAQGNILMQGNPGVVANLYANGNVEYGGGGNRLLIGGTLARGNIDLNGTPTIYFTEANESLIDGDDQFVPEGLRLIAYREWACRPAAPAPGCP